MEKRFEETDIKMNNFVVFYDRETKTLSHLSKKAVIDLLNEQDEKIKELESQVAKWKQDCENCSRLEKLMTKEHQYCLDNWRECKKENQQLKQQLSNEEKSHDLCIDSFNEECERLRKQIKFESEARKRFKQSQNSKAIEVLEKVREFYNLNSDIDWLIDLCELENFINNQITELKEQTT